MSMTIVSPKQLGTGTPTSGNFLRGDGVWQDPFNISQLDWHVQLTLDHEPSTGVAADWTLRVTGTPASETAGAVVEIGDGPFDGVTSGSFLGSSSGTYLGLNAGTGSLGNLVDLQVAGSSKFRISSAGQIHAPNLSPSSLVVTDASSNLSAPFVAPSSVATGDLWYGSASGTLAALPASSDGMVLTLASGVPSWQTPSAGVPTSRTLTMVGTTNQISVSPTGAQDLSADRSWTFSLAATSVTAGSYGDASHVPNYTVDSYGRLTAAASTAIAIGPGQVTGGTAGRVLTDNGSVGAWSAFPTLTGLTLSGLTASRLVLTDGSKNLSSAGFTLASPGTVGRIYYDDGTNITASPTISNGQIVRMVSGAPSGSSALVFDGNAISVSPASGNQGIGVYSAGGGALAAICTQFGGSSVRLGGFSLYARSPDLSTFLIGAAIQAFGSTTWTSTSSPSWISMYTTRPGTTAVAETARFTEAGACVFNPSGTALSTGFTDGMTSLASTTGRPTGAWVQTTGATGVVPDTGNEATWQWSTIKNVPMPVNRGTTSTQTLASLGSYSSPYYETTTLVDRTGIASTNASIVLPAANSVPLGYTKYIGIRSITNSGQSITLTTAGSDTIIGTTVQTGLGMLVAISDGTSKWICK